MPPPVYCGNYEYEAREYELERLFKKYGRVEKIEFKTGFCFVVFEDTRDAEDAIKDLDGREWGNRRRRLRVEFAKNDSDIKAKEERRREAAPPNTTLFVAGFDPYRTRPYDLERAFEAFGKIKRCNLRKSFCFVEFYDIEDAKAACKELHGTRINDREITVEFCVVQGAGGAGGGFSDFRRRDDRMSYDRERDDSRERRRPRSRSGERRRRYSPERRSRSPVGRQRRRRSPSPVRRRSPSPLRRSPLRGRSRSRSPIRERSSMSAGSP